MNFGFEEWIYNCNRQQPDQGKTQMQRLVQCVATHLRCPNRGARSVGKAQEELYWAAELQPGWGHGEVLAPAWGLWWMVTPPFIHLINLLILDEATLTWEKWEWPKIQGGEEIAKRRPVKPYEKVNCTEMFCESGSLPPVLALDFIIPDVIFKLIWFTRACTILHSPASALIPEQILWVL